MRTKAVLVLFMILFGLTAVAAAQESLSGVASEGSQQLKPMISDPGIPDTIRVNDVSATAGGKAVVEVHIYNDEELGGLEIPLKWSSPDITLDSVSFVGGRLSYIGTKPVNIDNANQRVLTGAIILFESLIPTGQGLAFTLHFNIPAGTMDQIVSIDSTLFPPGSTPVFSDNGGQTFDVGVRTGKLTIGNPQPTIGFSPSSFTFNATEGGSNPGTQTLTISNTGAGDLNWTLTKNSAWLGLAPTSGTNGGTVTVSANITGLTAATYTDTIVIAAAGASNTPQKVPVTLVVAAPPKPTISLSPTSFTFSGTQGGSNPMAKSLSISNTGAGTLNWTATKSSTWLSLAPTSGTGSGTVTVNVSLSSLVEGTYVDTIVVSDPNATNNPQRAIVTLTVAPPPKPTILLSPTSFTFSATEGQGNPAVKTLIIANSGQGTLNWTATKSAAWLTLSKTSGTGNTVDTLSVNITGLAAGTYVDTIVVSDPNATNDPQKASVTLIVAPGIPVIGVDPLLFTFEGVQDGANPTGQALNISNTGFGTLNWTVSKTTGWLGLDPTSGADDGTVTVSVDLAGLSAGTYLDTIVVADAAASNSPVKVPVTLNVTAAQKPVIALNPTAFTFEAIIDSIIPPSQTLAITNSGAGTLNWAAAKGAAWLTLDPTSGTGEGSVTVSVDITGLTAATYIDTIVVSDPNAVNSPQRVPVTLVVTAKPKPIIYLSPSSFTFNAAEGAGVLGTQTLTISSHDSGILHWTATNLYPWLTLDPTSGTGDGAVTLTVDVTGMTVGTYVDTIAVVDPNSLNEVQEAEVTLVITAAPKPSIFLSPNTFTFNAVEGAGVLDTQVLHISSVETGTLHWTATVNGPWLSLNPTSGVGDGPVTLTVDATGLAAGVYIDTIVVSDPEAANSPQIALVTLTITAAPQPIISVAPNVLEFSAVLDGDNPDARTFAIGNAGTGELEWYLGSTQDWLRPTPTSGSGNGTVTVDVDITGLAAGIYIDTIFVYDDAASNSPQYVAVGLTVTEEEPPCFSFPVDTINFEGTVGESIPSVMLPVTNPCGGTLTWTASWDSTWLVITPTSGGQDQMVRFQIDTTDLGPGTYYDIVSFESNDPDGPFSLVVRLQLSGISIPWLQVSDSLFDFGDVCRNDTVVGGFDIVNLGSGDIPWTAGTSDAIILSDHSGMTPAHVTFSLMAGMLPLGPQELIISVNSSADPENPQTIWVKLNVIDCGGECGFDIAEVEGGEGLPVAVPIYAYNINDVAGLEFHIWYDTTVLHADSVTSDFMAGPDLAFADPMIHYVWDSLDGAFNVPDGEAIMTLWFTVVGQVGQTGAVEWMGASEVVDPFAHVLNVSYCPGSVFVVPPVHSVTGSIVYYDLARPVPDVTVEIQGPGTAGTFTDYLGRYRFEDLFSGDYQVYAYRFDDDSGVTVADAVKMRRHLAYIEPFDSPYKMIAADVNASNNVSIADVIVVRRYLAMLDTLPSGNWVFVNGTFPITMENWYEAPREFRVTILYNDVILDPFVGVRMGDVNDTWGGVKRYTKPASADFVSVGIGNVVAQAGQTVAIPVTVADADDLAGLELHVAYDSRVLTYTGIASEAMADMTVNGGNGAVHMIWEDINAPKQFIAEQVVITLNFAVTGNLPASTDIRITGAELVNSAGDPYRLVLADGGLTDADGGSDNLPNAYALAQNSPNPFNPTTTIRATMADGGEFTLTIFNIAGEKVRQYRGWRTAGQVEITWDARDDNGAQVPSGIYLYRFQAGSFSQTKQMILLK